MDKKPSFAIWTAATVTERCDWIIFSHVSSSK